MTMTFDLAEVRRFTADLGARLDRCDNGEGMECSSLDATLRHYATVCCQFIDRVREWGRSVFAGRVAFDHEVEEVLFDEGARLYFRAVSLLAYGQKAEGPCYTLDGQAVLQSALWHLQQMLNGWVTPQLAVGPSARQEHPSAPDATEEGRRRIAALPLLPTDWQPADPRQRNQYKKLRNQRIP